MADQRLPAGDTHADPQIGVLRFGDSLRDAERRADCPLRIILMCSHRTEDRHHAITRELDNLAPGALNLRPQDGQIRREEPSSSTSSTSSTSNDSERLVKPARSANRIADDTSLATLRLGSFDQCGAAA